MSDVEIVKFIKTELRCTGNGIEGDPIRILIQYWDFEGNLIFQVDTWTKEVKHFNLHYNER